MKIIDNIPGSWKFWFSSSIAVGLLGFTVSLLLQSGLGVGFFGGLLLIDGLLAVFMFNDWRRMRRAHKVEGSVTWYDLAWVLWVGASLFIIEYLVHEAGHLSWLLLFRYEKPITYHLVWLGQTYAGTLPTLGLLPVTNYWLIVPGLLGGGVAGGVYWVYVTRRLRVGADLWILAPLTNYMAGRQLVYAIVEAIRNYPTFSNPVLWNSPELIFAPFGLLIGLWLLPRWVKERLKASSTRLRMKLLGDMKWSARTFDEKYDVAMMVICFGAGTGLLLGALTSHPEMRGLGTLSAIFTLGLGLYWFYLWQREGRRTAGSSRINTPSKEGKD